MCLVQSREGAVRVPVMMSSTHFYGGRFMKYRKLKKLLAVGLAGAMVAGMAVNTTAANNGVYSETATITLTGYGEAECELYCDYNTGGAEASTVVYADSLSYYVYAHVDLEMGYLTGSGYVEDAGSTSDFDEAEIDREDYTASASVALYGDISHSYHVGVYAYSDHVAEIDEVSGSRYLSTEDY